ncbi:MAG: hypothetical protein EOL98_11015 [Negativicutes bacterium]|nr:hypothetical protein [Negativicutes bacterium]
MKNSFENDNFQTAPTISDMLLGVEAIKKIYWHDDLDSSTTIYWEYGLEKTYDKEMLRDLLNRTIQLDKNLLIKILKKCFSECEITKNEIICETYKFQLDGIEAGKFHNFVNKSEIDKKLGHIELFISIYYGIIKNKAFEELLKKFDLDLSISKRFLLNEKYGFYHQNTFLDNEIKSCPTEKSIFEDYNFEKKEKYIYTNQDGSYSFILQTFSNGKDIINFPCSLFINPKNTKRTKIFDWLCPKMPLPLYNKHIICGCHLSKNQVFICENEHQCENILKNHKNIADNFAITTWTGGLDYTINMTDWRDLNGKKILIFVDFKKESINNAYKIWIELKKINAKIIAFALPNIQSKNNKLENINIYQLTGEPTDYPEIYKFAAFAKDHFDIEFEINNNEEYLDIQDLLLNKYPDDEKILDPIINSGDKVMILASRGSGKTWFSTHIACSIAMGEHSVGGEYDTPKPAKVLVIDGEMREKKLQERYKACIKNNRHKIGNNLRLRPLASNITKQNLENQECVRSLSNSIKWADVIFLDSLFYLFPGSMGSQIENCKLLIDFINKPEMKNKTVILIDHTGKNNKDSYGSIGKEIGLDLIIKIDKLKNNSGETFKLSYTKHRNLSQSQVKEIKYKFNIDANGHATFNVLKEKNETEITSSDQKDTEKSTMTKSKFTNEQKEEVIKLYLQKLSYREIEQRTGISRSTISNIIKKTHNKSQK